MNLQYRQENWCQNKFDFKKRTLLYRHENWIQNKFGFDKWTLYTVGKTMAKWICFWENEPCHGYKKELDLISSPFGKPSHFCDPNHPYFRIFATLIFSLQPSIFNGLRHFLPVQFLLLYRVLYISKEISIGYPTHFLIIISSIHYTRIYNKIISITQHHISKHFIFYCFYFNNKFF